MPDRGGVRGRPAAHGHREDLQGPAPRDAGGELTADRITLVTRVGCHRCADARVVVARVAEAAGTGWREVDVDAEIALSDEYGDRVPVVLVDGREHGYGTVEADRLLRELAGGRWPWTTRRKRGDSPDRS